MNHKLSAKCTLWVNRGLLVSMALLCFFLPTLLDFYCGIRALQPFIRDALQIAFYVCFPVVVYALWCIEELVRNILHEKIFVSQNVSFIRRIRWCCAGVSVLCIPAAIMYLPLIFLVLIMGFLALAVSVMVNVMAAAVAIQEENDLTI